MYDVTFSELIIGYVVFSSIYILFAAVYFRYKRKRTLKPKSTTRSLYIITDSKMSNDEIIRVISEELNIVTEPKEVLTKEENPPFSEAQKEYLREIANEVACLVSTQQSTTQLDSPATLPIPPANHLSSEEITEEELLAEPVLPIGDESRLIDSGYSLYYDEIGNLTDVMRGEQLPYREQVAAFQTARKMINTELFEQMMNKVEGAKQNLTTVFSAMASKYSDPTSENPYKVYGDMDYLPLKKRKNIKTDMSKISAEVSEKVRTLVEDVTKQPKIIPKEGDFDYSQYIKT